jgi:hypothetical protein
MAPSVSQMPGGGRNRPFIPAFAPPICLILLGIQAKTVLSNPIFSNPFGVRFGVREMKSLLRCGHQNSDGDCSTNRFASSTWYAVWHFGQNK